MGWEVPPVPEGWRWPGARPRPGKTRARACTRVQQENQGELIDLENCDTLVFRVLGDGRKYLASLRTENWVIGDAGSKDIYQAFLFARWAGP